MSLFPVLSGRASFDSSDNAATDTFAAGIRYTQAGAVRTTPDAGTNFNQGIPMSATGQVAVLDATGGLPADVVWLSGLPISGNKVCVSSNAVSAISSGTPYDSAGAVAGSGYFIPRMLFLNGEQGAWYDPSDITTLFQDSAGTTPVTAVEQPVGLMKDKSGRGNNAFQTTSTSRPTLRARYNLLTYSEQFDNAVWTDAAPSSTVSVTVNSSVAPDGNTTADTLTPNVGGTNAMARQVRTSSATTSHAGFLYIKAGTSTQSRILIRDTTAGTNFADATFNWSGGVPSIAGGATGTWTVTLTNNGWYRVVGVGASGAIANPLLSFSVFPDTSAGTGSLLVWGAQLLTAADVTATGNAYQRIAAATDYDTSNPVFRPYLAFDGSDDSMLTNSVDFSATDKMTVWAGVTKLSDATDAVLAELSASSSANNGSWLVAAPWDSGTSYYLLRSRGTTLVGAATLSSAYKAPATNVLTAVMDIVAPAATLRANGTQVATSTSSQGTGNYGNYPLYIGRRNNASLPFNGRLTSLIVRGAESTAAQISSTESWVNQRTGAY